MGKKPASWPTRNFGHRSEEKYPWSKWWASRSPVVLLQGKDYTCLSESLRQRIWRVARDARIKVSVSTRRLPSGLDELTLRVALPARETKPTKTKTARGG